MSTSHNSAARLYIVLVAVSIIGMHVLLMLNLPDLFRSLF